MGSGNHRHSFNYSRLPDLSPTEPRYYADPIHKENLAIGPTEHIPINRHDPDLKQLACGVIFSGFWIFKYLDKCYHCIWKFKAHERSHFKPSDSERDHGDLSVCAQSDRWRKFQCETDRHIIGAQLANGQLTYRIVIPYIWKAIESITYLFFLYKHKYVQVPRLQLLEEVIHTHS